MTSIEARNTDLFLRDNFVGVGQYGMPILYRQHINLENLEYISFDHVPASPKGLSNQTVHFYQDDYKFEKVWTNPEKYVPRLQNYAHVLSPDFSIYSNMPLAMQIYNMFRRRWCSAYWQQQGITVIPSVAWADERSYDFCFDGIERGGVVAVSTLGAKRNQIGYIAGFTELCRRVNPRKVLCYNTPFDEMYLMCDIIHIPYQWLRSPDNAAKGDA